MLTSPKDVERPLKPGQEGLVLLFSTGEELRAHAVFGSFGLYTVKKPTNSAPSKKGVTEKDLSLCFTDPTETEQKSPVHHPVKTMAKLQPTSFLLRNHRQGTRMRSWRTSARNRTISRCEPSPRAS